MKILPIGTRVTPVLRQISSDTYDCISLTPGGALHKLFGPKLFGPDNNCISGRITTTIPWCINVVMSYYSSAGIELDRWKFVELPRDPEYLGFCILDDILDKL